jgi:hypothetical protein
MADLYFGIDPGKNCGIAIWDKREKIFLLIKTTGIIEAQAIILEYWDKGYSIQVRFEDARKVFVSSRWADPKRMKGAGSIRRDSAIWEEFCEHYEIPFLAVAPQNNTTKLTAEQFKKMTGHEGRTSEHSRDGAMLVYGI